jgi:hypothetical protein
MDPPSFERSTSCEAMADVSQEPSLGHCGDGCPWQNGVAERWVGSCRRDLLNHVIILNEWHLKRLMALTRPSFCTRASERVYITASGCETEFGPCGEGCHDHCSPI